MGQGCCGIINLEFSLKATERSSYISRAFGDEFFSFYDFKEDRKIFKIKEDLLLKNYQSFLTEFYDIIKDKPYLYEEHTFEEDALQISDMNSFLSVYDKDNRSGCPYVPEPGLVSSLGRCWLFYSGTYKAYVDSYITYIHFKRILIRVMKNPLAKLVEFCEFS